MRRSHEPSKAEPYLSRDSVGYQKRCSQIDRSRISPGTWRWPPLERRLLDAADVDGVLAAAWEVFELVVALCAASADQATDLYPAFMFARGSAVIGRNTIAFAPSLSAGRLASLEIAAQSTGSAEEIAVPRAKPRNQSPGRRS